MQFFEQKIRPVLVQHCYSCHSAEAKKPRGGLLLDSRAGVVKGGASGPAVVPGKANESLLIQALRYDELAMPPQGKLPPQVIADFERWVARGAPDPREEKTAWVKKTIDVKDGRRFWSFQPPRHHPAPGVKDAAWPRGDIDRFLLARLEAAGLHPVGDADRATLLRRVTIDLIGLPPTPGEVDTFLADCRPDAFARVVDRLLASPHFGERWGRHWLDLARYADSNGKDENLTFHDAWRYRDYVIAAFNEDRPLDRFIREQIAGDLLHADSQPQRDEQLIATGFLVVGPKMLFDRDPLKRKMDVVDEQIDTVGRALLGLTVACARCHDHKFDPIPNVDYYALAGVFASTRTLDGIKENNPLVSGWMLRPLGREGEKLRARQLAHQKKIEDVGEALRKARADLLGLEGKSTTMQAGPLLDAARKRVQELEAEEKKFTAETPPSPGLAMAVRDEDTPADVPINIRGNPHAPGPLVSRGFIQVASLGPMPAIPASRSGRLELAQWLSAPQHPLTARVFVNRVWLHLFGEGQVRSVDDFGAQGERPSHPELLDELALRFIEDGWSVKKLVRALVLSRAYQLASTGDPANERIDPENRLCWRANRRRLDAEVLRDTMLCSSGLLDRTMGGSAVATLGEFATNNGGKRGIATDQNRRRSVYLPVIRNDLPPLFEVFDFADPDVCVGKRNATLVPTQALYLMNSPFVMDQARQAAVRLLSDATSDDERLTLLYRRALSRPPTEAEKAAAAQFLHECLEGMSEPTRLEAWTAICQAVFGCADFRFVK
jgi:Protein of unknown function (DUF1553)/Protein of unknown function (DUF1549)/Planctomycete cytochrome C